MGKRFSIYHAHGGRIGEANTLETAIAAGGTYGCRKYDCPCWKYVIYDNVLETSDMDRIIKSWVRKNTEK